MVEEKISGVRWAEWHWDNPRCIELISEDKPMRKVCFLDGRFIAKGGEKTFVGTLIELGSFRKRGVTVIEWERPVTCTIDTEKERVVCPEPMTIITFAP
ncbi:MAG: hypothetical protein JRD89_04815 [Deltaproteobacteria bacterium]|nr:hypothetical protein [Deltaproteobacteria bacterium]